MSYGLLVHFAGIRDPRAALACILCAWDEVFKVPLLFFSNRGPGQAASREFLDERSVFGRLDNEIYLRLRESRKRDVPELKIVLTNPDRAFYGDLNYIAVTLPARFVEHMPPSALRPQLLEFLRAVSPIGQLVTASFNHKGVALKSPGHEIFAAVKAEYRCSIGHLFYLPNDVVGRWGGGAALTNAGFDIIGEVSDGTILALPFAFESPVEAAWAVFDVLGRLSLLGSEGDETVLEKWPVPLNEAGTFLRMFEATFGRVFASKYSDGLRPISSA